MPTNKNYIFILVVCFIYILATCSKSQGQVGTKLNKYLLKKFNQDFTFYQIGYNSNKSWVDKTSELSRKSRYVNRSFPYISIESFTRVTSKTKRENYFFMNLALFSWINNLKKNNFTEYSRIDAFGQKAFSYCELFAIGGSIQLFKKRNDTIPQSRFNLGLQYRYEISGMAQLEEIYRGQNPSYPLVGEATNFGSGAYIKGYRSWYGINISPIRGYYAFYKGTIYFEYTPNNTGGYRVVPEISFTKEPINLRIGYRFSRFFELSESRIKSSRKFPDITNPVQAVNVSQFYFRFAISIKHDRRSECVRNDF